MQDPFRKYRRHLRDRLNHLRLKRERTSYEALFAARGLCLPDETALRAVMKKRYPHLAPRPKGTLNILALYHHYNWENNALKPALEKFGTVRHYDWYPEFNHQRKDWHGALRKALNRDLVARVERWTKEDKTDVIFAYLSGEQVTPETMARIAACGIPTVNLALNDKEHFVGRIRNGQAMGSRDICRCFDLCWTSTEDALKKYIVEGARPVYLPEGANPEIHRAYPIERTIDVSFVGQCYGNRSEIVRKIQSLGLSIEVFGPGWPNGPLPTEEMIRLYSKAGSTSVSGAWQGIGTLTASRGGISRSP